MPPNRPAPKKRPDGHAAPEFLSFIGAVLLLAASAADPGPVLADGTFRTAVPSPPATRVADFPLGGTGAPGYVPPATFAGKTAVPPVRGRPSGAGRVALPASRAAERASPGKAAALPRGPNGNMPPQGASRQDPAPPAEPRPPRSLPDDDETAEAADLVKSAALAAGAAQDAYYAETKSYARGFKELADRGLELNDSVCFSKMEIRAESGTAAPRYRFSIRHADRDRFPAGFTLSASAAGESGLSENFWDFECLNGTARAAADAEAPDTSTVRAEPDPLLPLAEETVRSAALAVVATQDVYYPKNNTYTGSFRELADEGLLLNNSVCYSKIETQAGTNVKVLHYKFSVRHTNFERFPVSFVYDTFDIGGSGLSETSENFECLNGTERTLEEIKAEGNGSGTDEDGASPDPSESVQKAYYAVAAAQTRFNLNATRYTSSYLELSDNGFVPDPSVCYGKIEIFPDPVRPFAHFKFSVRHADADITPVAYTYNSLTNTETPAATAEVFECTVGSDIAAAALPDPDGDARARAAYEAVARAENGFFSSNSSYSDSYAALIRSWQLKLDRNVCYGAIETHLNEATSKPGFKFNVRFSCGSSTVYSYDSTADPKATPTREKFNCAAGYFLRE
ncbi:MAG: hypothetical protein LBQ79_02175 [Deltaproteobacteria bacterium]|jgi:hypothetical protein|nr:hypothetical protein [Deltaproteobacteria bacterium]